MLTRIGLCLIAILSIAMSAGAQDKLQDSLLGQERKLIDAINRKDKAAISELLADEEMSITSRGKQTTKDLIQSLEKISFSNYQISEPESILVSPEVAILTYKRSWTDGGSGQAPVTMTVYASIVWRQRNGEWRPVFYQETPVAK